jgi:hypothetical protein
MIATRTRCTSTVADQIYPRGIALDAKTVYWTTMGGAGKWGTVMKLAK